MKATCGRCGVTVVLAPKGRSYALTFEHGWTLRCAVIEERRAFDGSGVVGVLRGHEALEQAADVVLRSRLSRNYA
jgi:hypothetical protein